MIFEIIFEILKENMKKIYTLSGRIIPISSIILNRVSLINLNQTYESTNDLKFLNNSLQ